MRFPQHPTFFFFFSLSLFFLSPQVCVQSSMALDLTPTRRPASPSSSSSSPRRRQHPPGVGGHGPGKGGHKWRPRPRPPPQPLRPVRLPPSSSGKRRPKQAPAKKLPPTTSDPGKRPQPALRTPTRPLPVPRTRRPRPQRPRASSTLRPKTPVSRKQPPQQGSPSRPRVPRGSPPRVVGKLPPRVLRDPPVKQPVRRSPPAPKAPSKQLSPTPKPVPVLPKPRPVSPKPRPKPQPTAPKPLPKPKPKPKPQPITPKPKPKPQPTTPLPPRGTPPRKSPPRPITPKPPAPGNPSGTSRPAPAEPTTPWYHGGRVLTLQPLPVYVVWYGAWAESDKSILRSFIRAFGPGPTAASRSGLRSVAVEAATEQQQQQQQHVGVNLWSLKNMQHSVEQRLRGVSMAAASGAAGAASTRAMGTTLASPGMPPGVAKEIFVPSLAQWWNTTKQYTNAVGVPASRHLKLTQEHTFSGLPFGARFTRNMTQYVLRAAIKDFGGTLPLDTEGIYLVLSAKEIGQEDFCSTSCGHHLFTAPGVLLPTPRPPSSYEERFAILPQFGPQLPYIWVGNAELYCPQFCGFPYEAPPFLPPQFATLVKPPNGRSSIDSMIIIIAHEMAETVTDPFSTGWYAGNRFQPVEISDMCNGQFGPYSYPGNPGQVAVGPKGEGYNVVTSDGKKFLLPMLWSAEKKQCVGWT